MVRFFNKVIRRFIYIVGLVVVLALGGIGVAGVVFNETISTYYKNFQDRNNGLLGQTQEILKDVQNIAANPEIKTIPRKIDDAISTVGGSLDEFKTTISNTKDNVASVEQSIQEIRDTLKKHEVTFKLVAPQDYENAMRRLDEFEKTAINLRDEVIPSAEKAINNVDMGLDDARKLHDIINISQLIDNVDKTVAPISNIVSSLIQVNNAVSSDQFSQNLKFVSLILMSVSFTLLSLGVITLILRLIFYKSVNGYIVKRSKARKQLIEFFEKACYQYPGLAEEIKKELE
ncbi:MG_279/MG_280 family protein [[Mycoplasma] imitans]|uniref:MG_279/MG_280 family protein n=1 Tax=[Mycoplasma] imitans TaxID=29560 RepID=UPI000480B46F|nr:MG_279/MG_280 family protein [[Mycoplasma] imitans]